MERWSLEDEKRERTMALISLGALVLFVSVFENGWALANMVLLVPAALLGTVCHELGHAVAAWLLRFDVFRITLGSGPRWLEVRFLGLLWDIRKRFRMGSVAAAAPGGRALLSRRVGFVLGGPLTNAVIAALGCFVLLETGYSEDPFDSPAPVMALTFVNGLKALVNLIPFTTRTGQRSDGKLILLALLHPARQRQQIVHGYYLWSAEELRGAGQLEAARIAAREGVARLPTSLPLLVCLGVVCADLLEANEAREAFEKALDLSQGHEGMTALQLNNLAYVDFLEGDEARFPAAASRAARAYALLPWAASIANTHAVFLIWQGNARAAVAAIEAVIDEEMRDADRQAVLGTLALAHLHCGNQAEAERCAREALALAGPPDALTPLVDAVVDVKAGGEPPSFLQSPLARRRASPSARNEEPFMDEGAVSLPSSGSLIV